MKTFLLAISILGVLIGGYFASEIIKSLQNFDDWLLLILALMVLVMSFVGIALNLKWLKYNAKRIHIKYPKKLK